MQESSQLIDPSKTPFADLARSFEHVSNNHNHLVKRLHIKIAGYSVRIQVVGTELAQTFDRAFSHLQTNHTTAPALTVDMWDQQETGVKFHRATRTGDVEPMILLKASEDGRFVGEEREQGSSWLDRSAHHIVGSTASATQQYLDERARPSHKLLSAWLNDRGIQFIHAGLVSVNGKGVLFVGNGGAGKSTCSIACLLAGIRYLGDDFIGLEAMEDGSFVGYGLFASCLLNVNHLKRFPVLLPKAISAYHSHEDKSVIYLSETFSGSLEQRATIKALALPRVVDADRSSFRPASKAEALLALAPTSVMFLPSPSVRALDRLARLVEQVPSFWLELGRDVDRIPGIVEKLVAQVNT